MILFASEAEFERDWVAKSEWIDDAGGSHKFAAVKGKVPLPNDFPNPKLAESLAP